MVAERRTTSLDRAYRLTVIVVATVASMSLAQEVLKPLALAVLLAFVLVPLVRFLERRRLPRVPAVMLAVALALGALVSIGYAVGNQLIALANDLPRYQDKIDRKLARLVPSRETALSRASGVARHVAEILEAPKARGGGGGRVPEVKVVPDSTYWERLESAAGPYLGFLGVGSIVLILVLFLLLQREDMSDRIIRLFGHRKIGLTTRTMDEAGRRISRYLAAFTAVNSAYGLVIGLGLWAIGVPLPALWGALAAALRFIPYVGPAAAFALPMLLSVVVSDGWREPILVAGLFGVLEVVATSVLEPVIYGKTTGVSAVGLLVAAMFWAWLWGPVGLLLSTPLTVCLAVAGKYVPGLGLFATLLGEEPALEEPLRLYQRLLAVDRAGARGVLDAALRRGTPADVFDGVLVPALAKAELDHARKEIDSEDRALVWRAVDDFLDELEWKAGVSPRLIAPGIGDDASEAPPGTVLGLAVADTADVLVLRMLGLLLAQWGRRMEIVAGSGTSGDLVGLTADRSPPVVVLSHLPPVGLTATRNLGRLLRERMPEIPVVVGLWGEGEGDDVGGFGGSGPAYVVRGVAEARDRVLATLPAAELTGLLEEALLAADAARAGYLFDRVIMDWPLERVCLEVIQPLLASVSADHAAGRRTRPQEESVTRFLREKLLPAVNAVRQPSSDARRALVACPGDDARDVASMMFTLLLRARGWDVLDLGDSVPAGRVPEAVATFRPQLVVLSGSRPGSAGDLASAASVIAKDSPDPPIIAFAGEAFSGPQRDDTFPGPVLPDEPQASLEAIDRLLADRPVSC